MLFYHKTDGQCLFLAALVVPGLSSFALICPSAGVILLYWAIKISIFGSSTAL
jgi:hypothetical protein